MDLIPQNSTQQPDIERPKQEVPAVDIRLQAGIWDEARRKNECKLLDEKWLGLFKAKVRQEVGVGTDFKDGDTIVAGYHWTDKFKVAEFRDENPDMHKKYVTLRVTEQFDEEKFRAENPAMWELYRTASFRFK